MNKGPARSQATAKAASGAAVRSDACWCAAQQPTNNAAKRAGNRRDEFKEVSNDAIAEVEKTFLNMTVKNGETFSDKSPLDA